MAIDWSNTPDPIRDMQRMAAKFREWSTGLRPPDPFDIHVPPNYPPSVNPESAAEFGGWTIKVDPDVPPGVAIMLNRDGSEAGRFTFHNLEGGKS
jgi:hypothetical protein